MSWIIQTLLNNREMIKEEANIASEEYNDLLMIEKAIETLFEKKRLTDEDLVILGVKSGNPISEMTRNEKATFYKKYAQLCDRLAYYLGGCFTDDGYLNDVQNKYKLDSNQMDLLQKYIKSEYKHKIMRNPIK